MHKNVSDPLLTSFLVFMPIINEVTQRGCKIHGAGCKDARCMGAWALGSMGAKFANYKL
jgi:hypothetical protein